MAFTHKISLFSVIPGKGAAKPTETEPRTVWADLSQPGITMQYAAQAAGRRAELQAKMRRSEYLNETHAVIDGVKYHIEETAPTDNPLIIRLVMAKGG